LKTLVLLAVLLDWLFKPGSLRRISDLPRQHENDNDDQHGADDADTTVSVAITISAEAATKAPSRKMSRTITRMSPSDMAVSPNRFPLF
jgi:hypothetical protein